MTIWTQFEAAIKASAYTDTLATFFERFARKLALDIRREDTQAVTAVLTSGDDTEILKMLRAETALLAIMTRVKNEQSKHPKESPVENTDTGNEAHGSLFDQP